MYDAVKQTVSQLEQSPKTRLHTKSKIVKSLKQLFDAIIAPVVPEQLKAKKN
jgi:hypothetical protein